MMLAVLLPVKNYYHQHLNKAIGSIFGQSCPHWLLFVIVEERDYQKFNSMLAASLDDPRVELIANEGRKLAGALNTGMRNAKTEFVAILLGDDMWANNAVAVLRSNITNYSDVDFFHSSRLVINEFDIPLSSIQTSKKSFSIEEFKEGSPVKHLLCWRREKALAIGGMDESLNSVGPDDYDFPWTMAEHGAIFKAVPECLYYYRDHRDSFRLTTHLPLNLHTRELERIFEKHGVDQATISQKIGQAKKGYLRQCLYKSPFDKWVKEKLGFDAKKGWRYTHK